jgi:hypothetical protein
MASSSTECRPEETTEKKSKEGEKKGFWGIFEKIKEVLGCYSGVLDAVDNSRNLVDKVEGNQVRNSQPKKLTSADRRL